MLFFFQVKKLGRTKFPSLASKKADKCWSSLNGVSNNNTEIKRMTAIEIIQVFKKKNPIKYSISQDNKTL